MLNKIKIIGEVLPIDMKEKSEEEREKNEPIFYFSLLVPNPSGSLTILRCLAKGKEAKEIEGKIKESEVLEVKGYLRNEKTGRQILVRVTDFTKLNIVTDKIENTQSNQARLLGKIVTDFKNRQNKEDSDVLYFRILIPRERNDSQLFFCRVQGELISEVKSKLKKGDIILLEGFLQTKKIVEAGVVLRISSIICQAFTLLDNDSANDFESLNKLTRIEGKVEKIDFTKPKENHWDEKTIRIEDGEK